MNIERKRMKTPAPTAWQLFSLGEMVLLCGAISGLQVIEWYPCPMVGIGNSKPGCVTSFWVWGPN
jgi:hypothetical protein